MMWCCGVIPRRSGPRMLASWAPSSQAITRTFFWTSGEYGCTVRHLFVCTNTVASGKPACGRRGGTELLAAIQRKLIERGASAMVTPCGCLGPCFDGPNAVVYPDGVWYADLTEAGADGVVANFVAGIQLAVSGVERHGYSA